MRHKRFFGILFFLTGIFAILGGLYTWGEGNIFSQSELIKVLIPWADLILTGPVSLLSGIGLLKERSWAMLAGFFTSGIYVFGSIMVFTSLIWHHNFSLLLLIPGSVGLFIASSFCILSLRTMRQL